MIPKFLLRFLGRLRFPWLFGLMAILFGIDLIFIDAIPFADELLLGLSTLLLGAWRTEREERKQEASAVEHSQEESSSDG